jgi:hypothetical protein
MTAPLPPDMTDVDRYCLGLLDHDGLMTPLLRAQFGSLTAVQSGAERSDGIFLRESSIYQVATGAKILDAVLKISLPALPGGFLDRLLAEDVLFGQLLIEFRVSVRIAERSCYLSWAASDQPRRWGRRLDMYRVDTGALLCAVDELLAPGAELIASRAQASSSA